MDEAIIVNAQAYAAHHELQLTARLGFGIHGIIFLAEHKSAGGCSAVKAHREQVPYHRERDVYHRLQEAGVTQILGFHVPQFIRADDELRVIEMSVVTRPFVLDFAGAYLDVPPNFPEEAWKDWELSKRDQFESRWPTVERVLAALEEFQIHMVDVSPSNIAFCNPNASE